MTGTRSRSRADTAVLNPAAQGDSASGNRKHGNPRTEGVGVQNANKDAGMVKDVLNGKPCTVKWTHGIQLGPQTNTH